MVECCICHKQFKMITNTHLAKHGITTERYLQSFPDADLCDEEMITRYKYTRMRVDRPVCAHPNCSKRTTLAHNRYCSYSCAMSHRMSKDGRNEQGGKRNKQYNGSGYALGKSQKRLARERDQHRCRCCVKEVQGKAAHVHHIVAERCFDSPEEAHALDNLVTLCDRCHNRVEWETIRELHRRAYLLDELLVEIDATFQPFPKFLDGLLAAPD